MKGMHTADGDEDFIRSWMRNIFPPRYPLLPLYTNSFIAGGWVTRSALKRITKADLDVLGVKEGHARMRASRVATRTRT